MSFCPNYLLIPNVLRRNPPGLYILDNCTLLSSIFVNIFLAKAFLILDFCLVVRKTHVAFLYLEIFLVILNVLPVSAADFTLYSWCLLT